MASQLSLFDLEPLTYSPQLPFKTQLLKWIGNKQRFAHEIINHFPKSFGTYYEPFLGSGAVLGSLAPERAIASDNLSPLIEIWQTLRRNPALLKSWYEERWERAQNGDKKAVYEEIKKSFNSEHNGADLLFLARSCYGGVIRFRRDGYMSTPCGIHNPIRPESFAERVDLWHERVRGTRFLHADFAKIMNETEAGDLVYCDPPYSDSQSILYGAQTFNLQRLFDAISSCKKRGVHVVLSIDGTKKNGRRSIYFDFPEGLFEHEAAVNCGRSMLRRFQKQGESLMDEEVTDRLLLTY